MWQSGEILALVLTGILCWCLGVVIGWVCRCYTKDETKYREGYEDGFVRGRDAGYDEAMASFRDLCDYIDGYDYSDCGRGADEF